VTAALNYSPLAEARADLSTEPDRVHEVLSRSILADGFDLVLDLTRSAG
jgi:L-lysine 6-transaminase